MNNQLCYSCAFTILLIIPPLAGRVRCVRPSYTTRHDRSGASPTRRLPLFAVVRRPLRSRAFEHTGRRPQPSTPAPRHPASALLTPCVGPRPPRGPSRSRLLLACPGPRNRHTIPIARGDRTRWPAVQFNGGFPPSGPEGVHPRPTRPCGRMTEKPLRGQYAWRSRGRNDEQGRQVRQIG